MNSTHMTMIACTLFGVCHLLGACHHPRALYEDAPRPPIEVGREYENNRRYARAEAAYQQIDDIVSRNMTLDQLAAAWDSTNATITRAQRLVSAAPQKASARFILAQACYQKALLCTRYTRESQGNYPRDYVFGEQDHFYSQALQQSKIAIRLDPTLTDARLLIAKIYLASSLYDQAFKELKRLIVSHPKYARGYYALGKMYLETGQYDKVRRYLVRSIKLDPDFLDAYYLLGQYFLDIRWYDYAAKTFLEILRRKPADSPSFDMLLKASYELGKFYVEQGAYDQGILLFQAILKVYSSHEIHQSLLHAKTLLNEATQHAESDDGLGDSLPQQNSPSQEEPPLPSAEGSE
ncbi:hypothetical protein CSB45_13965 [candidate division KSB3 bacterium]|uniref:Uncharacterized protein n=1 Tax=candidate division KSB3 bacterium TaxID=2044937 RepID=A0A2G6E1K2_9BACT|nr:MAG: hypothetical protein CSB45_13965 [candidate division KSB3 bacterium]PIE28488.1 MAG: hypothetical protein CSA57_13355 [candidate division KSB3 bacterium]